MDIEKIRKRMMLNYLISRIFADNFDLKSEIEKINEKKKESDPFTLPKEPLPEQEVELKPLKFLQRFDGERFKALKNKALKQETINTNAEETVEVEE